MFDLKRVLDHESLVTIARQRQTSKTTDLICSGQKLTL